MEKPQLKILLVDDDEDDFIITRDLLSDIKGQQYQIDWVSNFADAITTIAKKQHDVHLIDYRLGAHNGLELLHWAINEGISAPFILLTGQGDREVDLEAMRAGAVDYLVKEYLDPILLERSIRYAIEWKKSEALREALLESERQLNAVTRAISSNLDLALVLPDVVRQAAVLIGADAGGLALINNKSQSIYYPYLYNLPNYYSDFHRPRGLGVAWHIVESGEALLIDDYAAHPKALEYWIQAGVHSFIGVPVRAGHHNLGVLALFSLSKGSQFGPRELALSESVGQQAGFVIQNARLFAEAQDRAQQLEVALTKLEELDRLKSTFIRNASHELRTPLAIMRGYIELMAEGEFGVLLPTQEEPINIVTTRAKMLTKLVDDIIAVLNVETAELHFENVNFSLLVKTIFREFALTAKQADIELTLNIDDNLRLIRGSPNHLSRVIDNLLSNAIKFTAAKGTVVVSLQQNENDVWLKIEDSGIGIPEDELDKIFDRFYQVDGSPTRHYGGTGLGLALVKEIVEAHHGRISVESIVNEGSTFHIDLPCIDEAKQTSLRDENG